MQKGLDALTKYIIKTFTKKEANVLACFGYLLNISNRGYSSFDQLLVKEQDLKSLLRLT